MDPERLRLKAARGHYCTLINRVGQNPIISVPGVPSELQGMLTQSLKLFFDKIFTEGKSFSRRVTVKDGGESMLVPVVSRIVMRYPEIYTKTLASAIGDKSELGILMTIMGTENKKPC